FLIHAGEVLSTDQIVDAIWEGNPPRTATTGLWNLITQLRKVLPADVLVTTPPGYRLQIDPDALDLRRFERLVARARPLDAGPRAAGLVPLDPAPGGRTGTHACTAGR